MSKKLTAADLLMGSSMRETEKILLKLKNHGTSKKTDTYTKEDGAPSVGLVSPSGGINAAPKPKDVKKMRKALDSEK
jgi:hypothetical protein